MCQCHDIYDPVGYQQSALVDQPVTQCHDIYEPVAPGGRAHIDHHCRFVSETHGPVRVVRVCGRLDWATAGGFRDLMRDECIEPEVIADLRPTTSMDSAGTGVLLAATARAKGRGQQVVVVAPDPLSLEVLISVGLDLVVPIVASEAKALAELGSTRAGGRAEPRLAYPRTLDAVGSTGR